MIAFAMLFTALSALVHVYIFWLESIAWTTPRGMRTFRMSTEQAHATKQLAFNQGFYNLFLAAIATAGLVFLWTDKTSVGAALVYAGAGSMVAAGVVLWVSSPRAVRAALVQLTAPLLAIATLTVALLG